MRPTADDPGRPGIPVLDVLAALSEGGSMGSANLSLVDTLATVLGARVVPCRGIERWQVEGYEHLLGRILPDKPGADLQVVVGWQAVEETHYRRIPYVVYIPWFGRGIPHALKRKIRRAKEVWTSAPVPSKIADELSRGSGPTVRIVPFGHDPDGWERLRVTKPHGVVAYTVGPWEEVLPVVEECLLHAPDERLLVVSPDCPIRTKVDLQRFVADIGAVKPTHEPVFISGHSAEHIDTRSLHLHGDCYLDATGDFWHRAQAAIATNIVVQPDQISAGLADIPRNEPGPYDVKYQLELGICTVPYPQLAETLRFAIGGLLDHAETKQRKVESEAEPEIEPDTEALRALSVVVPHLGRGGAYLEPAIASVRQELIHDVVVVDYGSGADVLDEVRTAAVLHGWSLVEVAPADRRGHWNLAHARNVGAKCCKSIGIGSYLLFLDCDVILPRHWNHAAAAMMEAGNQNILVPKVVQGLGLANGSETPQDGSGIRIASGLALFPAHLLWSVGGQDEGYTSWGYEDVDYLWRVREKHDVEIQNCDAVAYHQPHPPWEEVRAVSNAPGGSEARFEARMQGDGEPVNVDGWGAGGVVTVLRGRPRGQR